MIRKAKTLVLAVTLIVLCRSLIQGQAPPTAVLQVDIENVVQYQGDTTDLSKFGTNPKVTPAAPAPFGAVIVVLGDIVAVNGQPAKGTFVGRHLAIGLSPTPTGGTAVAIADTTRLTSAYRTFEIMKNDGTPVGTIMALGLNGGSPSPPGPPAGAQNFAIVGGTGAFLGVRGQTGGGQTTIPARGASITEDPAFRRVNGGGKVRWQFFVIPMAVPQFVITANGPAVTHSDFTLVSASKPAAAGEILSAFVTGLGPTVPSVDFGQPFPATPPSAVNSPLDVTVNGRPAEVTAAVGYPGSVDGYQVNFRVPKDAVKGVASIQISAAWITGTEARIVIQ